MDDIDSVIGTASPALTDFLAGFDDTILVLGAGGKMGMHLCLQLDQALRHHRSRGQVIAVSRFGSLRGREEFEQRGLKTRTCDLSDETAVAGLPESRSVYYLAGVKFGTSSSPELLHQINVVVPALVARRFPEARIVALSTGCVYPFVSPASGGATETMPVDPVGDYARSCVGREEAFIEAARKYGTRSVLIRLNYSTEYRYGVLIDVATRVYQQTPIDLSTGYLNAIWQSDAVDMIARALPLAAAPPAFLNLTGPETISLRQLALTFGRKLNREVRFQGEEAESAWLSNSALSHRLLGAPRVSYDEMIERTAEWVRSHGPQWGKPTNFERRDGNF